MCLECNWNVRLFTSKLIEATHKSFLSFKMSIKKFWTTEGEREQGHKYLLVRNYWLIYFLCISFIFGLMFFLSSFCSENHRELFFIYQVWGYGYSSKNIYFKSLSEKSRQNFIRQISIIKISLVSKKHTSEQKSEVILILTICIYL